MRTTIKNALRLIGIVLLVFVLATFMFSKQAFARSIDGACGELDPDDSMCNTDEVGGQYSDCYAASPGIFPYPSCAN